MTISVETLLVVSLMMAVFAAVATVGSSLFLGAGFERLRLGLEAVKRQTAFFSDALRKLDGRVSATEKQTGYFFEALHKMETGEEILQDPHADTEDMTISAEKGETHKADTSALLRTDELRFH